MDPSSQGDLGDRLELITSRRGDYRKKLQFRPAFYCQLGHVDWKISDPTEVADPVTTEEVIDGITNYHKKVDDLDYITFSGTWRTHTEPPGSGI